MKKRFLSFLLLAAIALAAVAQSQVKYVFYFIGDGMGVNQINVTETYLAALKGRIGTEPILMSSFPVVGLVNTYSATNGVTDSAAGGTALASGHKTKNGAIGVLEDLKTPCHQHCTVGKGCRQGRRRSHKRGHHPRHPRILLRPPAQPTNVLRTRTGPLPERLRLLRRSRLSPAQHQGRPAHPAPAGTGRRLHHPDGRLQGV